MEHSWIALALNDFIWIGITFTLGLVAKKVGLPPLVGFLLAGFLLSTQGVVDEDLMNKMADLGITLLLFTIGLKINVRNLIRPQVWAVTAIHTVLITMVFAALLYGLAIWGVGLLAGIKWYSALLLAFAASFSSTVYVVKAMEKKGEIDSLHGRMAIGVLIIQDIFAVIFLAVSANKLPTVWAFALLLLIPAKWLLFKVMDWVGRGELLVLFGFLLAIGGAEIFEMVGIKGDLGALILGTMIATHAKAEELVKTMLGFKDLFLLGFFLSIGLNGQPDMTSLVVALIITPFIVVKSAAFFGLFTRFDLRSRTALLSTINLSNYSEFGLIVIAVGVTHGWLEQQWLVIMALSIAFSFVVSALLNARAQLIYHRFKDIWMRFQSERRLSFDKILDISGAKMAVVGMGAIGTGAFDQLSEHDGQRVIGIDINAGVVQKHCANQKNVILGDPSDTDFWERVNKLHTLKLVVLTLPKLSTAVTVAELLRATGFQGEIAAIAKYPDEITALQAAGVDVVANIFTEAGAGFATHVLAESRESNQQPT